MGLNHIEIENFKGISTLKFDPKQVNILVGKNNTGKTSVLEAIHTLFRNEDVRRSAMSSLFNIYCKERVINLSAIQDGREVRIIIRDASESEAITAFSQRFAEDFLKNLQVNNEKPKLDKALTKEIENSIVQNMTVDLRNFLAKNSLVVINQKEEKSVYQLITPVLFDKIDLLSGLVVEQLERLLPPAEKAKQSRLLRGMLERTTYSMAGYLDRTKSVGDNSNIIYVRSILDGLDVSFLSRRPEDSERLHKIEKIAKEHKFIGNLEKLEFDNVLFSTPHGIRGHTFRFLGDGFKAIIGLLWHLSSNKISNSIILLDEPDSHMHPGYILELINFIVDTSQRFNVQFFITTHCSDVLEIFLSDDLEENKRAFLNKELRILKMGKIKDSRTLAECLDYTQAREAKNDLLLDLRGI